MHQLFNIGDIVTVRSEYIENTCDGDYPFGFIPIMIGAYGRHKVKIVNVRPAIGDYTNCKLYLDSVKYDVASLTGTDIGYNWSSAMFKESDPYIVRKQNHTVCKVKPIIF